MRALIVTIIILVSFGPSSLVAQNQEKATGPQPAQAQDGQTGPANPPSKENDNERRVMERLGPGMDWDHRKAGRDWKLSFRREKDGVNHERD
jgi:hypothetical protein